MSLTPVCRLPSDSYDDTALETSKEDVSRRYSVFSAYFTKFVRQELSACISPMPSLCYSAIFFFLLTVAAIPLGAALFWQTLENTEVIVRYDNFPVDGSQSVTNDDRKSKLFSDANSLTNTPHEISVSEKMDSPVYVYYELKDFYQNHKRYIRSKDEKQLGGETPSAGDLCNPYRYLKKDNQSQDRPDESKAILPCGLIAHSFFNDSFALHSVKDAEDQPMEDVRMEEHGIATEWDRKYLYGDSLPRNFNNDPAQRGGGQIDGRLDENEHFMVWMRVGSRATVRKLYGIIRHDIPKGSKLTFNITHRYNTYDFDGQKRLILSTSNWTGGRNEVIGIVYFVIGALSAVACIVILGLDLRSNRKPGDLSVLSWNKEERRVS